MGVPQGVAPQMPPAYVPPLLKPVKPAPAAAANPGTIQARGVAPEEPPARGKIEIPPPPRLSNGSAAIKIPTPQELGVAPASRR